MVIYRGAHFNGHMYIYCILWSIHGVLFLVYSISYLKSPHLPLHQCFPPHCKNFAYRGVGGLYACKNRASMSKQRRGMTFSPMFGKAYQFNGGRMVMLRR